MVKTSQIVGGPNIVIIINACIYVNKKKCLLKKVWVLWLHPPESFF